MPSNSRLVAECSIKCVNGSIVDGVKVYRDSSGCRYIDLDGNSHQMAEILKAKIFVRAQDLTKDFFNNSLEG